MRRSSRIVALAVVVGLCGCDMPERRLAPIADVFTYTTHADLQAAGAIVQGRSELQLTTKQAQIVFARIKERRTLNPVIPANLRVEGYGIFLTEVHDPIILRARIRDGQPRPFVVTLYELGADGVLDRSRDMFVLH